MKKIALVVALACGCTASAKQDMTTPKVDWSKMAREMSLAVLRSLVCTDHPPILGVPETPTPQPVPAPTP